MARKHKHWTSLRKVNYKLYRLTFGQGRIQKIFSGSCRFPSLFLPIFSLLSSLYLFLSDSFIPSIPPPVLFLSLPQPFPYLLMAAKWPPPLYQLRGMGERCKHSQRVRAEPGKQTNFLKL